MANHLNAFFPAYRLPPVAAPWSWDLESRTDSNVSSLLGPGRTLGRVFNNAGRRLEPILSRAAERRGVGPNALAHRAITLVFHEHQDRNPHCTYASNWQTIDGRLLVENSGVYNSEAMLDTIVTHASKTCPGCSSVMSFCVRSDSIWRGQYSKILASLIDYIGHPEPSTCGLTLEYVTALAASHCVNRLIFARKDKIQLVEQCVEVALTERHIGWSSLLAPAYVCLESLVGPHLLPMHHDVSLSESFELGPSALVRRLLLLLLQYHCSQLGCRRRMDDLDFSPELVRSMTLDTCDDCGGPLDFFLAEVLVHKDLWNLFNDLLSYARHPHFTIQKLTGDYINALALAHPIIRHAFVADGAIIRLTHALRTAQTSLDCMSSEAAAVYSSSLKIFNDTPEFVHSRDISILRHLHQDPLGLARAVLILMVQGSVDHVSWNENDLGLTRQDFIQVVGRSPLYGCILAANLPIAPLSARKGLPKALPGIMWAMHSLERLIEHSNRQTRLSAAGYLILLLSLPFYLDEEALLHMRERTKTAVVGNGSNFPLMWKIYKVMVSFVLSPQELHPNLDSLTIRPYVELLARVPLSASWETQETKLLASRLREVMLAAFLPWTVQPSPRILSVTSGYSPLPPTFMEISDIANDPFALARIVLVRALQCHHGHQFKVPNSSLCIHELVDLMTNHPLYGCLILACLPPCSNCFWSLRLQKSWWDTKWALQRLDDLTSHPEDQTRLLAAGLLALLNNFDVHSEDYEECDSTDTESESLSAASTPLHESNSSGTGQVADPQTKDAISSTILTQLRHPFLLATALSKYVVFDARLLADLVACVDPQRFEPDRCWAMHKLWQAVCTRLLPWSRLGAPALHLLDLPLMDIHFSMKSVIPGSWITSEPVSAAFCLQVQYVQLATSVLSSSTYGGLLEFEVAVFDRRTSKRPARKSICLSHSHDVCVVVNQEQNTYGRIFDRRPGGLLNALRPGCTFAVRFRARFVQHKIDLHQLDLKLLVCLEHVER